MIANTAGSAPTIALRRPSSASFGERASGASAKRTPLALQSAMILSVETGSLVVQSIRIRSLRAAFSTPLAPKTISSTTGVSVTQMMTTSDFSAASAGVFASVAPRDFKSSTGARLRFPTTVKANPLAARLRAMPRPMAPSPMNPMRGLPAVTFGVLPRTVIRS